MPQSSSILRFLRPYFYFSMILLGFLVFFVCSALVPLAQAETMVRVQSTKSFSMVAKRFEFTPSSITVTKGDTVDLTVSSQDVTHGLSISEFGVNETIPAGESKTITFTASQAGTFSMVCSVFCGSGHGSMSATLIVQDQSQQTDPDTQAPTAPQNLAGTSTSATQVDLSWIASEDNVGVKSYVVYRNGTSVLTPSITSATDTGLTPGTKYSYQVTALDAAGNESSKSSALSITTLTLKDETPPSVSNILETQVSSTSAKIKWTSDEPSVGQVEYGVQSGSYTAATPWDPSYSTTHATELSGLTAGKTYYYRIKSTDESSNLGIATERNFTTAAETEETEDRNAPKISDVASSNISSSEATVTFTTNEEAKATVEYGITTGDYTESEESTTFQTKHELKLSGLTKGTIYYFRVKATDQAGNFEFSSQQLFTTLTSTTTEQESDDEKKEVLDDETNDDDPESSEDKNTNDAPEKKVSPTLAAPKLEFVQVNEVVVEVKEPLEAEQGTDATAFTSKEGEPVLFKGKTIPDATVTLRISSDPFEVTTISDASGNWSYTLTQALEPGDHTVEIAVRNQDGEESSFSEPIRFQVEVADAQTLNANAPTVEDNDEPSWTSAAWVLGIVLVLVAFAGVLHMMKRRFHTLS